MTRPVAARGPVIAIDGPSGCGKSTAALGLARRLRFLYVDTGAMYRAVALGSLQAGIAASDVWRLAHLARRVRVNLRMAAGRLRVTLGGRDVTQAIRTAAAAERASQIAVIPEVRRAMVAQQRRIGRRGQVVAEGRDTGTVVFPSAPWKFYLTASLTTRARRRWRELRDAGSRLTFPEVRRQVGLRDRRDMRRATSPLRRARGAWVVDTTRRTRMQTLQTLLRYLKRHPVR